MELPDWTSKATMVTSLNVEIYFLLHENFYYGPDEHEALQSGDFREALTLPDIPRKHVTFIGLKEVAGYENLLADYYEEIVRVAAKHNKTLHRIQNYFWLRLLLWDDLGKVNVSFPWYDTYKEINRFLESMNSDNSGKLYWDADQSWMLEVYAEGEKTFLRESDPDGDELHCQFSFLRAAIRGDIQQTQERAEQVIALLAGRIGRDCWTDYIRR